MAGRGSFSTSKHFCDGETIVLHYLGPHELGMRRVCGSRFSRACKLDDALETVGIDVSLDQLLARLPRCATRLVVVVVGRPGLAQVGVSVAGVKSLLLHAGICATASGAGLRIAGIEYRESQRGPGIAAENGQTGQFAPNQPIDDQSSILV